MASATVSAAAYTSLRVTCTHCKSCLLHNCLSYRTIIRLPCIEHGVCLFLLNMFLQQQPVAQRLCLFLPNKLQVATDSIITFLFLINMLKWQQPAAQCLFLPNKLDCEQMAVRHLCLFLLTKLPWQQLVHRSGSTCVLNSFGCNVCTCHATHLLTSITNNL